MLATIDFMWPHTRVLPSKKRRLLEESPHSLRSLKIKCLKSIQDIGEVLTLDTFTIHNCLLSWEVLEDVLVECPMADAMRAEIPLAGSREHYPLIPTFLSAPSLKWRRLTSKLRTL